MEMNKKIEEVVAKAGVAILNDEDALIVDDEWTPERETLALELLNQDKKVVPAFWQEKYEREAAKSWDLFYKRNTTNFYKDRHYLHLVFPDLAPKEDGTMASSEPQWLLEVGCGVGNAALPLLEVNPNLNVVAIDFAPKAVDLFKEQPLYDPARVHVSVCDITKDVLPVIIDEAGGVNYALFMFCLSALRPDKMQDAVAKIASAVRPGGKIFFRDYGRYDQAQLRFKPGHKLAENFYVRQDNTRAYYFTTEEVQTLFEAAGMVQVENEYIRRQYANRSQNVVRFRVWIHAVFEKPMQHQSKAERCSQSNRCAADQSNRLCNDAAPAVLVLPAVEAGRWGRWEAQAGRQVVAPQDGATQGRAAARRGVVRYPRRAPGAALQPARLSQALPARHERPKDGSQEAFIGRRAPPEGDQGHGNRRWYSHRVREQVAAEPSDRRQTASRRRALCRSAGDRRVRAGRATSRCIRSPARAAGPRRDSRRAEFWRRLALGPLPWLPWRADEHASQRTALARGVACVCWCGGGARCRGSFVGNAQHAPSHCDEQGPRLGRCWRVQRRQVHLSRHVRAHKAHDPSHGQRTPRAQVQHQAVLRCYFDHPRSSARCCVQGRLAQRQRRGRHPDVSTPPWSLIELQVEDGVE